MNLRAPIFYSQTAHTVMIFTFTAKGNNAVLLKLAEQLK